MRLDAIPFGTTDWSTVEPERHAGDVGEAIWRTRLFGPADNAVRVRMVEYSAGYVADHWCAKGHILLCLSGDLSTTLEDGRSFELGAGMSYQVADGVPKSIARPAEAVRCFS